MKLKVLFVVLVLLVAAGGFAAFRIAGAEEKTALDLVPEDAALVATFNLDGGRRADLDKLLQGTPVGDLDGLIEIVGEGLQSEIGEHECDLEGDLGPFLDRSVTVFGIDSGGAAILEVDEPEKPLDAVARCLDTSTKSDEHRETAYRVTDDGVAFGEVGEHVVIGKAEVLERVIDTFEGDASVGASEAFTSARARHGTGETMFLYLDLEGASEAAALPNADALEGAVTLAAYIDQQTLTIEGGFDISPSGVLAQAYKTAFEPGVVEDLPVTSWFAAGVGDLGSFARAVMDAAGEQPDPPITRSEVKRDLKQATGLDLEEDLLSWMGPAAVAATGEDDPSWVGPTLLIEAKRPQQMRQVVADIIELLKSRGVRVHKEPLGHVQHYWFILENQPVEVHVSDPLISITLRGQRAIGGGDLDQTDEFTIAAEALGDVPVAVYFDAAQYKDLLGPDSAFAVSTAEAEILNSISFFAAGGKVDGSRVLIRTVTTFTPETNVS